MIDICRIMNPLHVRRDFQHFSIFQTFYVHTLLKSHTYILRTIFENSNSFSALKRHKKMKFNSFIIPKQARTQCIEIPTSICLCDTHDNLVFLLISLCKFFVEVSVLTNLTTEVMVHLITVYIYKV